MAKKRIFSSLLFLAFLVSFTICFQLNISSVYASEISYNDYLQSHRDSNADVSEINISALDYEQGEDVKVEDGYLFTGKDSLVTYKVDVPTSGLYNIAVMYQPVTGGSEISRKIYVNSELPFEEAEYLVFDRFYKDANHDYKNQKGNQAFPSQLEVSMWREKLLSSSTGYILEPYQFYLEAGSNTLTFEASEAEMLIDYIALKPVQSVPTYDEYIKQFSNQNPVTKIQEIKIQAEDATIKSSPSLYPLNDRTSSLMEPYDPTYIVLNSIGGTSWRIPGQFLEWEVEVPETGLYKIALKYKQSDIRGTFSTRKMIINGEVPFLEAGDLRFDYNTAYTLDYLGEENTGDGFYFYLEKGKNIISLEVSLGAFGDLSSRVEDILNRLNGIYRDVIVITSTSPDKYRDYQLDVLLPNLSSRLIAEKVKLEQIVEDIGDVTGSFTSSTTTINRLINNLNKISDNPNNIASYLAEYQSAVTALGDWIVSMQRQPLTLDYLIVAPEDYKLPDASEGFVGKIVHEVRSFLGSFINNYNSETFSGGANDAKTIDVWVSTGRDQFQILRRLVSDSFSKENDINVNLKLVDANSIFPASLTGNGPDVNIQVAASTPINFGYRDGAYNLAEFDDFDEVADRFLPAAMDTFKFMDTCYALPDQMSFPVMFYRTDIFNELGLEAPATVDEFLSIVPILQKNNMDIYFSTVPQTTLGAAAASGSTRNINPIYLSLLFQNGGELYLNNGQKSDITSDIGVKTFKFWTELYTKHNFIVETDFTTRFRMGEIPIGIVDFTTYNTIAVSAPEIRGDWAMAQIPGTMQADGTINYDTPVSVSGSLIVKNVAEKKGTVQESWDFIKWWTSEETQYSFAVEMEAVLGLAGRYPVANLNAFEKIAWGKNNLKVLNSSLEWTRAVPQVPGSYITGRVIENAFSSIVTDNKSTNATDAIYNAVDQIDQELTSKRREFNIE